MTTADPWGLDEDPLDLGGIGEVAGGEDGQDAADEWEAGLRSKLDRARALGWVPLHPGPLYRLVPAAWPRELRCWIADPRADDDEWPGPWRDEEDVAGLPPAPPGRVWLLRSPWPDVPVYVVYEPLRTLVDRRDRHEIASMYRAASTVLGWSQQRALEQCSAETRQLLEAWRAAGRSGSSIEQVVEAELTPDALRRWTAATGLSEELAVEWLLALTAAPDEETLRFVREWVEAGLPHHPPRDVDLDGGYEPRDLRRWLDAGFGIDDALSGEGMVDLDVAIAWKDAGFAFGDTQELLAGDHLLTVPEALAFVEVGIADEDRPAWVRLGFSAADAAAWTRAGLTAGLARLWRARGWEPDKVIAGRDYPPNLFPEQGYYPLSAIDEIPDPPGTRGTAARSRRAR